MFISRKVDEKYVWSERWEGIKIDFSYVRGECPDTDSEKNYKYIRTIFRIWKNEFLQQLRGSPVLENTDIFELSFKKGDKDVSQDDYNFFYNDLKRALEKDGIRLSRILNSKNFTYNHLKTESSHENLWWLNWSNGFAAVAALSGLLIPVLNQYQDDNVFTDDHAHIMLVICSATMAIGLLLRNMMNCQADNKDNPNKYLFTTHPRAYSSILILGLLSAAGVAASCAWLLATGSNELPLPNIEADRTFTALYGTLCGAVLGYGVAQGVEMNRLKRGVKY